VRNIDAAPAMGEEQNLLMLFDPSRLSDKVMLVPQDILYIIQFMDGKHSLLDIRTEYMRKFGSFLFEDRLNKLVEDLDAYFLLDNDRFVTHYNSLLESYRKTPFRESILAGESYEADPQRLDVEMKEYFTHPSGPGLPATAKKPSPLAGIIAPHIDIRVGGPCYAHAYRHIVEAGAADLYVIIGTCHTALGEHFAATTKDFKIPYGTVQIDQDFISAIQENWQGDLFKDELMHQVEHTIEFQLVFLQYLFREKFRIAPILSSFSYNDVLDEDNTKLSSFLKVLKAAIDKYSGRVCVIASVDLSHVGPRYGDTQPPSESFMSLVRRHDMDLLDIIIANDADGFVKTIARGKNKFRVCGFSPIYTMLKTINAGKGKLLKYESALVDGSGSAVTFASAAF
jgi:AmmeMemoRadiSam system protein B